MKLKTLFVAAFAALSLISVGCGGGSEEIEEEGTFSRTLLVGTGDSTTQTTKRWREVLIKVNSNYTGAGADQACPVELVTGSGRNACNPLDSRELRSDGKWRAMFETAPPDDFISDWTLTGDTLVLVGREMSGPSATYTYKLTDEGVVARKQRIRMTLISAPPPDGTYPSMVGFQYVIEEI